MDMYKRDKGRMSLRPYMTAAYAGDGGAKGLARDIGVQPRSAKDYFRTGDVPRRLVVDALRALDRKLAHRQAQIAALRADVLERLRHETDRANHLAGSVVVPAAAPGAGVRGAAVDHQANPSGGE